MGQLDNLISKVNQFMTLNKFDNINSEITDVTMIFKESLKSVWSNESNIKKRDIFAHQITNLMTQYLGGKNTSQLMTSIIEDLDIEYPPESDYIETYNLCLSLYEDFINKFISKNQIEIEKLEIIIKKFSTILKKNKANIVSHIALRNNDYNYNVCHAINTTILALISGDELKLSDKQLRELGFVGLLHDIGMLKISDEILKKEEKLTDEEYNQIKTHPVISYKLLNEKNIFGKDVLEPIIQHHEQFDGNGYPRKLPGEKIHIYAKIITIADAFEAQISDRAYRKSKTGYSAMKEVLSESQNRFDPKILRAFLSTLSIYPPGTLVQLNNNAIASVVSINSQAPLRPLIKVLLDEFGDKPGISTTIDLKNTSNLFIVRVLDKEEYASAKQQ